MLDVASIPALIVTNVTQAGLKAMRRIVRLKRLKIDPKMHPTGKSLAVKPRLVACLLVQFPAAQ